MCLFCCDLSGHVHQCVTVCCAKMKPVATRMSGPVLSSSSFRVKFSQTLDFLLQTSHSNSLANPPRLFFFPQVNVINSAVCVLLTDHPPLKVNVSLHCPPLLSRSPFHSSLPVSPSTQTRFSSNFSFSLLQLYSASLRGDLQDFLLVPVLLKDSKTI